MKNLISDLSKESLENSKRLKQFTHNKPGRLALEDSYPNLNKAIVVIDTSGAGIYSGRRTEDLSASLTLDDIRV